jgi:hypothetical protein
VPRPPGPAEGLIPVDDNDDGPTAADLAALLVEQPLIEAEVALVDAQIRALVAEGGPSPLDVMRLRRAMARVLCEWAVYRLRIADREPVAENRRVA